VQKAQIAGAQKWPFAGVRQMGLEGLSGLLGTIPIALGNILLLDTQISPISLGLQGIDVSGFTITIRALTSLYPQPTTV